MFHDAAATYNVLPALPGFGHDESPPKSDGMSSATNPVGTEDAGVEFYRQCLQDDYRKLASYGSAESSSSSTSSTSTYHEASAQCSPQPSPPPPACRAACRALQRRAPMGALHSALSSAPDEAGGALIHSVVDEEPADLVFAMDEDLPEGGGVAGRAPENSPAELSTWSAGKEGPGRFNADLRDRLVRLREQRAAFSSSMKSPSAAASPARVSFSSSVSFIRRKSGTTSRSLSPPAPGGWSAINW